MIIIMPFGNHNKKYDDDNDADDNDAADAYDDTHSSFCCNMH